LTLLESLLYERERERETAEGMKSNTRIPLVFIGVEEARQVRPQILRKISSKNENEAFHGFGHELG